MKILLALFLLGCTSMVSRPLVNSLEEVDFLELDLKEVEVRIDTGAMASTLHASEMKFFTEQDGTYVEFKSCHNNACSEKKYKRKVLAFASVKSSNGRVSKRPIIKLSISLKGQTVSGHFTLYDRSKMNYSALIGRDMLTGHFYVNPDVEDKIEIP